MKRLLLFMLLAMFSLAGIATKIDVKQAPPWHSGRPHSPSATVVMADYDDGVVTVNLHNYTGTVQVELFDACEHLVSFNNGSVVNSGVITTCLDGQAGCTYFLRITLSNGSTYSGSFEYE